MPSKKQAKVQQQAAEPSPGSEVKAAIAAFGSQPPRAEQFECKRPILRLTVIKSSQKEIDASAFGDTSVEQTKRTFRTHLLKTPPVRTVCPAVPRPDVCPSPTVRVQLSARVSAAGYFAHAQQLKRGRFLSRDQIICVSSIRNILE